MRIVKLTVLMSSLLVSLPVFANSGFVPTLVRAAQHGVAVRPTRLQLPYEKALRLSGLKYIVGSKRIREETLEGGVNSPVGASPMRKLKCTAYKLCEQHLNKAQLDRLVDSHILQDPFPGYYNSFSASWAHFAANSGKLGTLEIILEAAYGSGTRFEGSFLTTYGEVVALSQTPFQAASTCREALENAYDQGLEEGSGFFVIQVQATAKHPQDVLLLELHNPKKIQFLSLRQSLGEKGLDIERTPASQPVQPQKASRNTSKKKQTTQNPEEDSIDTYFAMRRMGMLPDALPPTYVNADGVEVDNFPVWTKEEFNKNAVAWRQEHPFEADLAPYLERYFGVHLPQLYNFLSPVEKESILFNTPGLADALPPCTTQQYDEAVAKWIEANGKEPQAYLKSPLKLPLTVLLKFSRKSPLANENNEDKKDEEDIEKSFAQALQARQHVLFYNKGNERVPFKSLSYERQVEALMWAWRTHHITPPEVLTVLGE